MVYELTTLKKGATQTHSCVWFLTGPAECLDSCITQLSEAGLSRAEPRLHLISGGLKVTTSQPLLRLACVLWDESLQWHGKISCSLFLEHLRIQAVKCEPGPRWPKMRHSCCLSPAWAHPIHCVTLCFPLKKYLPNKVLHSQPPLNEAEISCGLFSFPPERWGQKLHLTQGCGTLIPVSCT